MQDVLIRPQQDVGWWQPAVSRQSFVRRYRRVAVAVAAGLLAGTVAYLVDGPDPGWTRGQNAEIARLQGLAAQPGQSSWTRGPTADIARLQGIAEHYQR